MEFIQYENAPPAHGHYSPAVRSGNTLYISGQGPFDPASGKLIGSDITAQTEQTMRNLGALLQSEGLTFRNVVKTTVYLTRWEDFPKFNEEYSCALGDHKPARATVAVSRLGGNSLLEMEVVAEYD
jgi:2-iminobutanoate/2-iminopropanoate deaminase